MSGPGELRHEVDRALARLELYETVLRNIADGHWNVGRAEAINANEYARQALDLYHPRSSSS